MWRIYLLLESMEDLVYRSDAVLKIAKDSERIWARENIPYFDILGKIKNRFRGERSIKTLIVLHLQIVCNKFFSN